VLEGSVRKAGGRVRITAQLIEGASDGHVWADRWDRDLTDIFALQDEISEAIVKALKLKLLPEEKKAIERRGTDSAEAYDLCLMARQYLASGNTDRRGLEAVLRLCRRASEIDPNYARAWALMAQAMATLRFRHGSGGEDGLATAERALALDPDLAEAHAVKAGYLHASDRRDEAHAELGLALRLDPDSFEVRASAGYLYFRERRLKEAIAHYEAACALMETAFSPPGMLITCYAAVGDRQGLERAGKIALERAEKAVALDGHNGQALGFGAGALAALGDAERTREWVARAMLVDPENRSMRYNLACALSLHLKDIDGALELLGPYLETATWTELGHVEVDPDIDPIREHPRMRALVADAWARVDAAKGTRPAPAA